MKKTITRMTVMMMTVFVVTVMLTAMTAVTASALTKTVKQGVATRVNFGQSASSSTVAYYKIKPTKTGIIKFTVNANYSGYVSLCNSKKKVISRGNSNGDWIWGGSNLSYFNKVFFGVKKGKTYFVKIKGYSYDRDSSNNYVGSVKWTNTKFSSSKHGKTKGKAKTIKKKKTVKGVFPAGNKKAHWYKITNKQKNTYITFKAPKTNGSMKVKILYKSYGHWYNVTYRAYRDGKPNKITGTISKKVKHTYYLKVTPDGKSSGTYSLKWK